MSYPFLLLVCLLMMGSVSLIMYFIGTKISYNYILYNATVSIGTGVIFFLLKLIFTMSHTGPMEQILDTVIIMLLCAVWIVSLIETFTIEVMENGQEIKRGIISLANTIKSFKLRSIPNHIRKSKNLIHMKLKSGLIQSKLKLKVPKLLADLFKNRVLNKRV